MAPWPPLIRGAFAMDLLTRINYGTFFAVFILPAWAVVRLPSLKMSIPIGSLIFYGWLVLASILTMDIDPSYDSFGYGCSIFFGLPVGVGYCAIWILFRRLLTHLKSKSFRSHASTRISLVIWSALIGLCLCFPFMAKALHHRSMGFYMPYVLIGVGPILLLSLAMVCSTVSEMRPGSVPGC